MDIPLQITFRGLKRSAAVETALRDHAAKLEQFHPHVMSCHAVVELADRHKHQGKQFVVRLDIRVPGAAIAVNRDHSEEPLVAVRDAFDAARRQLADHLHRVRGDVKSHRPA